MNKPDKPEQIDSKEDSIKDTVSLKEIGIIIIGIIVIFAILLIIPNLFKQQARTMAQMHEENYNNPSGEKNYIYNGFCFLKLEDPQSENLFWYTQYQREDIIYDIPMHYGPKEVENITKEIINSTPKQEFKGIYITIDPKNESVLRPHLTKAVYELQEKLRIIKSYNIMYGACTENKTKSCVDRQIITCDNTEDFIVIYMKDDVEDAKIAIDGNCIIVQGTNESLIQATDKLIYGLLGIMK